MAPRGTRSSTACQAGACVNSPLPGGLHPDGGCGEVDVSEAVGPAHPKGGEVIPALYGTDPNPPKAFTLALLPSP